MQAVYDVPKPDEPEPKCRSGSARHMVGKAHPTGAINTLIIDKHKILIIFDRSSKLRYARFDII
jgi:hypothetical protein